jgi:2-hydroxychromene-2-carboxylate isomerase
MVEFFFDCSSPWTYLAFHNIQPLAAELNVPIHWKPILVGGIFNSVNPSVYEMRKHPVPAKQAYMLKDLQDWSRAAGLKIVMPPKVFPVNSVKAMRGCIWLEAQDASVEKSVMVKFAKAVFEAYWAREEDISQDAVLADICESVGVDVKAFFDGISQTAIKDQLKANTEEVISRGGFGSPTIFVANVAGDDMYFGNDRLGLVRSAILAKNKPGG